MPANTLSALRHFPQQLQDFFALVPHTHVQWIPATWEGMPSETFSALEQICHVRDIEIDGYHHRFRRLLTEQNPFLESIDGYALVSRRRYAEADPVAVFAAIRTARERTLALLEGLDENQLKRGGIYEEYGQVTVKSMMHILCSHDQQHLAGMQWLLARIESDVAFAGNTFDTSMS
jgi:hypothetical protein